MDYSHLHTYAPPQCLPENTGYTYSLSSSYSTAALDFENLHKLDPVFGSPRMSRRSLRLSNTTANFSDDLLNSSVASNVSFAGSVAHDMSINRSGRQRHNSSMQSSSSNRLSLKGVANASFQSSFSTHVTDTSTLSTVLDESSIREQTEVDHLWGLDEDDPKAGDATMIQANGDVLTAETQTTLVNGYTCNDCSMLSERSNVLTAYSASRTPAVSSYTVSTKVYSRDRSHKSRELPHYAHKAMVLVRSAMSSLTALLMSLFHMVMLKLGYELKAHSNFCGSMNVKGYRAEDGHLHMNGETLCDDCKGMKQHEKQTTVHTQSSRARRVAGSLWHIFSYTGYLLMQAVRNAGAAGWFVSRKVLSFLWLAIVSPGKAASGMFWWLGTGWYQLSTLVSLLNIFLLTRCLPRVSRALLLLIPLLLLLGLWLWGFDSLLAVLPLFSGFSTTKTAEDPIPILKPTPDAHIPSTDKTEGGLQSDSRMRELEKKFGLMVASQSHHAEDYNKLKLLVLAMEKQMAQMNDPGHMSVLISGLLSEHLGKIQRDVQDKSTEDHSVSRNHEARILHLEALLRKLSEAVEEDRKRAQSNASEIGVQDQNHLRTRIESLEKEFEAYKAEFLKEQSVRSSCDLPDCILQKVDARVRESVQMMFGSQANLPEALLQWLSANYVSNKDFNARLQEMEIHLLRDITHQVSITGKIPTSQMVEETVRRGIAGITEQEARVIVNNALKLYSQDRTGMVDFALESGGGSILGTRCSETYETKTALVSLFGIPLWYLSQSPRVVIQPDMYPGNCWAFKGAQGYLVVRLSMEIFPTAFSLEHIPKSLSPTGNITSAPKDFAVYGLGDEYQEDGVLLVQSKYNEEGEPLQIFHVTEENKKSFQIVELRILSNWGHSNYTCLYRFRVHGTPVKKPE
ncbi:SUN domain-containing protein 1 isoform X1 [Bufo gargarizans]|uniref:SUN domain-containing protein 1 isoform X1 n=2 Tax=Bufo gargarizans TaxID=30331 RepID=UPI001CF1099C|nr:SUN domain-containing protein 1 isoform X1 [Bufo gargarizans]